MSTPDKHARKASALRSALNVCTVGNVVLATLIIPQIFYSNPITRTLDEGVFLLAILILVISIWLIVTQRRFQKRGA